MRRALVVALLMSALLYGSETTRAIVLGIAQDGGVPQIGCTHEICRTQRHPVSSLALASEQSLLLVDATPDLRSQHRELVQRHPQLARKNLFDGIFLTHAHMGHYTGLLYLGKESISTQKVPVYCSEQMAEFLQKNAPWSLLVSNNNIELHPFKSGEEIKAGDFRITPLAVPHRKEFTDTHGFLIRGEQKSLLYIPDIDSWDPVKQEVASWLQKSDYALLDATFYSGKELPGRNMSLVPHPTVEASVAFLATLPPMNCKVFFTHLNHTNPLLDPSSSESKTLAGTPHKVATEWQEFPL